MKVTLQAAMIFHSELYPGVEQVNCSVHDDQLIVNWLPPANFRPSEYVIQWVSVPNKDFGWKRVSRGANNVSFKGNYI